MQTYTYIYIYSIITYSDCTNMVSIFVSWFAKGGTHVLFFKSCYLRPKTPACAAVSASKVLATPGGPWTATKSTGNAGKRTIRVSHLAPLEHTEIDRIISIWVLNIGFSKLSNPLPPQRFTIFKQSLDTCGATWLPLPTTQSRNCSTEYEWFVATSLFQSPCVSRVCLRMSLKSSHPIALAASMYTCSWAMSAKRIASWKANSCCTFTSTRPSLSQLHGLSSSMTNDLLVQSTLDLWWMQQWKNNEASCHSSRFAKGCKEVNAAPYLISILKCHQNYSAKNSSGFNGVYQQSTEQDVGCGQSLW